MCFAVLVELTLKEKCAFVVAAVIVAAVAAMTMASVCSIVFRLWPLL